MVQGALPERKRERERGKERNREIREEEKEKELRRIIRRKRTWTEVTGKYRVSKEAASCCPTIQKRKEIPE